MAARVVWSIFCAALWYFILSRTDWADTKSVSEVLGVVWILAFPRNGAKWLAWRARRRQDLYDAADEEYRRRER